jgi:hypothetical protein
MCQIGPRQLTPHRILPFTDTNLEYFVDVRDNALLHVAALLDPEVKSERLFAFAKEFNWNDIVTIMRRLRPENKLIPDAPREESRDLTDVKDLQDRALKILRSTFGKQAWTSLEESIAQGLEGYT